MPLRRWKCVLCGDDVIEGQRFTVLRDGFVHLECLYSEIARRGRLDGDILALMDILAALNYLIVRVKEALRMASDEKLRDMLNAVRIDAEKHAAQLSALLEKKAGLSEG